MDNLCALATLVECGLEHPKLSADQFDVLSRIIYEILFRVPGSRFEYFTSNKRRISPELPDYVMLPARLCQRVAQKHHFVFLQPLGGPTEFDGYCAGASIVVAKAMLAGARLDELKQLFPSGCVPDAGIVIQSQLHCLSVSQSLDRLFNFINSLIVYYQHVAGNHPDAELLLDSMDHEYPWIDVKSFLFDPNKHVNTFASIEFRAFLEAGHQVVNGGFDSLTTIYEQLQSLINGTLPLGQPLNPTVQLFKETIEKCPVGLDVVEFAKEKLMSYDSSLVYKHLLIFLLSKLRMKENRQYIYEVGLQEIVTDHGFKLGGNLAFTREAFTSIILDRGVYLLVFPIPDGSLHQCTLKIDHLEGIFYDPNFGVFTFPSLLYSQFMTLILHCYEVTSSESVGWMITRCTHHTIADSGV